MTNDSDNAMNVDDKEEINKPGPSNSRKRVCNVDEYKKVKLIQRDWEIVMKATYI